MNSLNKCLSRSNIIFAFGATILFIFLFVMGHLIPEGYDWVNYFSKGNYPLPWMPWTSTFVQFLNLPAVFAVTLMAIGIRVFQLNGRPIAIIFAVFSLPTLWVFYLGNLDGIALLGLLLLPWGAPLVLVKPQVASFALLARKKSLIFGVVWIVISILVWGFWPKTLLMTQTVEWKVEFVQDINLFPWGFLIAIPLMWLSRSDEDLLMAAGSFATPHLFPYHFIVLMPALSRMRWSWMVATWLVAWTPLLSNWLGDSAWHFGNLIGLCFWFGIYINRKPITEEELWPSLSAVREWINNLPVSRLRSV